MTTKLGDKRCTRHNQRNGTPVMIEGGAVVNYCERCKEEILKRQRFVCKYCRVPIKSQTDASPVFPITTPHKMGCPRSKWGEIE